MQIPANARLKCEFGVADAIGTAIIWILLTIVTLGLALFVAPYYVYGAVVNRTLLVDMNGNRLGQLKVKVTLAEIIGHAVIWLLLSIVTLGLALVIYYYMVLRKVFDRTEIDMGVPAGLAAAPAYAAPPPPPPAPAPERQPPQGAVRR